MDGLVFQRMYASPMWYEDPIFDNECEEFQGKVYKGDAWRKLQRFKEGFGIRFLFAVAGTTFKAKEVKQAMEAKVKQARLIPEPDNPHDKDAVKVVVAGCEIGYVPRSKRLSPQCRVSVFQIGMEPKPHVWLAVKL